MKLNIIYKEHTSSIRLEENGKESLVKQANHFYINHFYITDMVGQNEVNIECCPKYEIIAGCITKPLVGGNFKFFRDIIMNIISKHHNIGQQECGG